MLGVICIDDLISIRVDDIVCDVGDGSGVGVI